MWMIVKKRVTSCCHIGTARAGSEMKNLSAAPHPLSTSAAKLSEWPTTRPSNLAGDSAGCFRF